MPKIFKQNKFALLGANVLIILLWITISTFLVDLFQSDMGVILDGYFKHGVFYSDDMLVKHDNEYVSEDGETYNVENYSK